MLHPYHAAMLRPLLLGTLTVALCGMCSASSLYFTGTGTFSATDTPETAVTPGDTFSFSFVVPSNPVTNSTNSTTLSFDVTPLFFTYKLNGTTVNIGQPTAITFDTSANGGGLTLNLPNNTEFILSSSQYFTGTTAAPVFSPTSFPSETFLFLDNSNVDPGAATASLTLTPEPSSLLLLCGGLGLLAVGVRKSVRAR